MSALREIQLQIQRSMQSVDDVIEALSTDNQDHDRPLTTSVSFGDSRPVIRCDRSQHISPRGPPHCYADQFGQLRPPHLSGVDAREETDSACPDDGVATPSSEPERFVAAVTVEFAFRRLDYDRVAMSSALWVALNQRVQEVVAEGLEVPPGVVDVHLLQGNSHSDLGVIAKSVIRLDSDLEMAEELRVHAMRSGRELLRQANVLAAAVPGVRAAVAETTDASGAVDLGVADLRVTVSREELEEDLRIFDDDCYSQDESPEAVEAPGSLEIVGRPLSRPPSAYPGHQISRPPSAHTSKPLSRPSSAFMSQSIARPSSAYFRQVVEPVYAEDPVCTSSVQRKDKVEDPGDASISQATSSTQTPGAASSLLNTGGTFSDADISEGADAEIEPAAADSKSFGTRFDTTQACLAESARIAERFGIGHLEKKAQAMEAEWAEASNMNDVLRAANELLRQELEEVMLEAGDADLDWSSDEDEDCQDDSGGSFCASPVTTPRGQDAAPLCTDFR